MGSWEGGDDGRPVSPALSEGSEWGSRVVSHGVRGAEASSVLLLRVPDELQPGARSLPQAPPPEPLLPP